MARMLPITLDGVRYTILCLAHVRKERADDGVVAISGTYGVTGGADSLIILTGNRHATGRAIEVVSRDDEGCELALTFTEHGLFVTDEDPHPDPSAANDPGAETGTLFGWMLPYRDAVMAGDRSRVQHLLATGYGDGRCWSSDPDGRRSGGNHRYGGS